VLAIQWAGRPGLLRREALHRLDLLLQAGSVLALVHLVLTADLFQVLLAPLLVRRQVNGFPVGPKLLTALYIR
jgi:hypothetical protein